MTNATKTLAILFAGTIALALATSWSWSTSSSAAFQENLLAVDTSAVQGVRIERSNGPSVRLTRSDGEWSVATADAASSYPASRQAVDRLLNTLPNLQVGAVPTRQSDKHPRYGVDSTGTKVTLLGANDEAIGELIIGRMRMRRPQSQGRQGPMQRMRRRRGTPITYVREPGKPDVYSVETSFRSVTGRSVDGWRKKQLWAVDRSNVQRVDFTFPADSSFSMQRAAPSDTASGTVTPDTWISAGDTLSTSKVSSILRTLSSPTADGFKDELSPSSFGTARYTIRLHLQDGSTRTLQLRPDDEESAYVATTDEFPYVVTLRKSQWDRSVLQGRTALLPTE